MKNEYKIQHEKIINNHKTEEGSQNYILEDYFYGQSLLIGMVSVMGIEKLSRRKAGMREPFYSDLK